MNEYTFRFYKNDHVVKRINFKCESIEDAYKLADKTLKNNTKSYDDWECVTLPIETKTGTQKSPFGIGS